jgi:hypothetical protein
MIARIRKIPPIRNSGNRKNPGKNPARAVAHDVHDLHLLAGLLRGLHLFDALRDADILAGPVGPDPDADPREDRHDHGCDHHSSTHLTTSFARVCIHGGAEM